MCGTFLRENREIPLTPETDGAAGRFGKVISQTLKMHVNGKSDGSVIPTKQPNNAEGPAAEAVEGRDPIKGNTSEQNTSRTQSRPDVPSALDRVRKVAIKDKKMRFTALLHHVCMDRFTHRVLFFEEGCGGGGRWDHVAALRATA
jgi:RNA-directed DNA polymerase